MIKEEWKGSYLRGFEPENFSVYNTSFRHSVERDLVPAFTLLKKEWDPWARWQEVALFSEALTWYAGNKERFEISCDMQASREELESAKLNVSVTINYWTLWLIKEIDMINRSKVDFDRPVAFSPGKLAWETDVIGSTRGLYQHLLEGENKIPGDLFDDNVRPSSPTGSIELAHRYLAVATYPSKEQLALIERNERFTTPIMLEAKDILMRLLLQKYLHTLLSRGVIK